MIHLSLNEIIFRNYHSWKIITMTEDQPPIDRNDIASIENLDHVIRITR